MFELSNKDRNILVEEAKYYADMDSFVGEWGTSSIFQQNTKCADTAFPENEDWKDIVAYLRYCYKIAHITIKEIRSYEGLSQQAFAEKYFLSQRSVENWECGHRECVNALRIALAFASGAVSLQKERQLMD